MLRLRIGGAILPLYYIPPWREQGQLYLHRGADKSLARSTSRCILFDDGNISFDASLVIYRGADKSLPRLTSRCILFDGENISFDISLVIYT